MLTRDQRDRNNDIPIAKPRRYTETTNVAIRFDCSSKARITCGTPGAKNDDASGVMNVTAPSAAMMDHFFFAGQFRGFAGSSGPSQSTMFGSRASSCTGASPVNVRSSVWVDSAWLCAPFSTSVVNTSASWPCWYASPSFSFKFCASRVGFGNVDGVAMLKTVKEGANKYLISKLKQGYSSEASVARWVVLAENLLAVGEPPSTAYLDCAAAVVCFWTEYLQCAFQAPVL